MKSWFIYILRCSDNSLYTGISKNVDSRIEKHNSGKGSSYTRSRLPAEIVYQERIGTHSEALKREFQIKKLTKNQKEEIIKRAR